MSNATKKSGKKTFVKFGALIKGKEGGYYVTLDKELTLNVNGKPFTGKYINVDDPKLKFQRMLDKGLITEEEYQEKIEKIPEYIRQELTIVLE
jgi:hypothetical protein